MNCSKFVLIFSCTAIFLVGCDGTSVKDSLDAQNVVSVVNSVSELPDCTEDNEGKQAYVRGEPSARICADGKWFGTLESGDFSCTTEKLSDGSGLKIVCNGDSVGVVMNGSNGKSSEGCAVSAQSDSTVTITCGKESTTLQLGKISQGNTGTGEVDPEKMAMSMDSLDGYSQKGPFLKGSTVYLYELESGRTLKQTNGNFTSNILSDNGRYLFAARDLVSQYALIMVEGHYRNEVTGKISNNMIRLKALTDLSKHTSANVNLLSHLEFERVYYLVTKEKKKVWAAKQQAQEEILKEFGIVLPNKTDAEEMDVFGSSEADAALLALSILLQGNRTEAEMMALLTEISADMAKDGQWNGDSAAAFKAQIADWAFGQKLSNFRKNVEGWHLGTNAKVGDFEKYINNFIAKTYGIDTCKAVSSAKQAVNNKWSVNNGRQYQCYEWENQVTWADKREEKRFLRTDDIEYGEMLDWRDRRVYSTLSLVVEVKDVPVDDRQMYYATWLAENLDFEYRVDGKAYGSYCYTDDCSSYDGRTFGHFYTWGAAMDSAGLYSTDGLGCGHEKSCNAANRIRGICPDGWHLPSKTDWATMINILVYWSDTYVEGKEGASTVGMYLKSGEEWNWDWEALGEDRYCVDLTGFSAAAVGFYFYRPDSHAYEDLIHDGHSYERGLNTYFWTSTSNGFNFAYALSLDIEDELALFVDPDKDHGFSVRCLKD
ncbi:MAG: hypothetical protein IJ909_09340 [Fibrobacter sp.]|nr:hypothetical protein [Fibrobacter sp.]